MISVVRAITPNVTNVPIVPIATIVPIVLALTRDPLPTHEPSIPGRRNSALKRGTVRAETRSAAHLAGVQCHDPAHQQRGESECLRRCGGAVGRGRYER